MKAQPNWRRRILMVASLLIAFGALRLAKIGGKASGGDVDVGCGGGAADQNLPQDQSSDQGNEGPVIGQTYRAAGDGSAKLFDWNSCYKDDYCVEQWGSYNINCLDWWSSVDDYSYSWRDGRESLVRKPGKRCKSVCEVSQTCPHGCMTNYDSGLSWESLGSTYECETTKPSAKDVSLAVTSTLLTGSFSFVQKYGGENWSVMTIQRADDSSGTNASTLETLTSPTTRGSGDDTVITGHPTSLTHSITSSDLGKWARFCVTPKTGGSWAESYAPISGSASCSGWKSLDIPSASNVTASFSGEYAVPTYSYSDPLNTAESGTTFQWYWSFNGTSTIGGVQSTSQTWKVSNFSGTGAAWVQVCVTPRNTNGAAGTRVCSSITQMGAPRASAVLATISGGVATGSYVFGDAMMAEQPVPAHKWYRAIDSSGTNATAISGATSATHTLVTADRGTYLQYCVTPYNTDGDGGTQVCSTGVFVGPSATDVYTTFGGGQWLGSYTFSDNYPGASESGSTVQWYGGASADGDSTSAISNQTNRWLNSSDATGFTYVFYCVTPNDGTASGQMACSKPLPTAWNVAISGTAKTGSTLTGNYSFTCGTTSDVSESGSTYAWYTVDASGNRTAISGATSRTFSPTAGQSNTQVEFCVTPVSANGTGSEACSAAVTVLPAITWYSNGSYGGTAAARTYEFGTCVNMSDLSMDNQASSMKFYAQPSLDTYVTYYLNADCSGTSGVITASAGSMGSVSAMSALGVNDQISSFRVWWKTPATAGDVSISISNNVATVTYTYSGDLSELGSSVIVQRADDASGTNTGNSTTGSTRSLQTGDNNRYLRGCVTPANVAGSGTQVCSSWMYVGHMVNLWTDSGYNGTNVNVPYELSASGTCFSLETFAMSDSVSSLKLHAVSGGSSRIKLYKTTDCSGASTSMSVSSGGTLQVSSMVAFGTGWNDAVRGFTVTF